MRQPHPTFRSTPWRQSVRLGERPVLEMLGPVRDRARLLTVDEKALRPLPPQWTVKTGQLSTLENRPVEAARLRALY